MEQRTRIRELRNNAIRAERAPWQKLSARKIAGPRLHRQVAIGPFIADFVSHDRKLVIVRRWRSANLRPDRHRRRTGFTERQGFRVIRFWTNDAIERVEGVVVEIESALAALPSPNPSCRPEGGA